MVWDMSGKMLRSRVDLSWSARGTDEGGGF